MKVAYSCAGEGFGHASRMVALGPLLRRFHQVLFFLPATVSGFVGERLGPVPQQEIPAFLFSKTGDRINYAGTLVKNIIPTLRFPFLVAILALKLRKEGFDAVISDYEPILAWAGRLAGLPVLQINHPGIVHRFLDRNPQSWLAGLVSWLMEGPWDRRILTSFFRGDVGPILRPSLRTCRPAYGSRVVLNLKPEYKKPVMEVLKSFPDLEYDIFPRPEGGYDEALAQARFVISSAGHQTMAESLFLGKPMVVIPQKGQWEQVLNAGMLQASGRGLGTSLDDLPTALKRMLEEEDDFRRNCRETPPGYRFEDGTSSALKAVLDFLDGVKENRSFFRDRAA